MYKYKYNKYIYIERESLSKIPFLSKNNIQCKSLVSEIPTSFIFQPFSTWNAFFDVTKQLFHDFVSLIQFENSKLKLLPLEMCHKYPCFQQGAPYPLQRSSTCENGSVAERRDNW